MLIHVLVPFWVVPAGFGIVGLAGIVFLWELLANWLQRGPRDDTLRCPKCWYDMRGSPGLRCSECGREAKSAQELKGSRRRWGRALLAVMFAGIGIGLIYSERAVNGTWYQYVPSWALVRIVGDPMLPDSVRYGFTKDISLSDRLIFELWWRCSRRELSFGQRQILAAKQFAAPNLPLIIHTRSRWPAGVPIRFYVEHCVEGVLKRKLVCKPLLPNLPVVSETGSDDWGSEDAPTMADFASPGRSYSDLGFLETLRDPPRNIRELAYDVSIVEGDDAQPIWAQRVATPVTIVKTVDEAITPVRTAEVDAAVEKQFRRGLMISGDRRWLRLDLTVDPVLTDIAVGFSAELRRGERAIAVAASEWRVIGAKKRGNDGEFESRYYDWNRNGDDDGVWLMLSGDVDALRGRDIADDGDWTIRVRGDANQALLDLDAAQYWAGEFTMNLSDVPTTQPAMPRRSRN